MESVRTYLFYEAEVEDLTFKWANGFTGCRTSQKSAEFGSIRPLSVPSTSKESTSPLGRQSAGGRVGGEVLDLCLVEQVFSVAFC